MTKALRMRAAVAAAVLAPGVLAAVVLAAAPSALADPPPNCTAADLAQVNTGVSAATSVYLFSHPDFNAYLTDLEGMPPDVVRARIADYMAANPQVHDEFSAIRQPLVDMRSRCGGPSDDAS